MPQRPIYAFNAVNDDGTSTVVYPNDLYADDHPYVRKYPGLFEDVRKNVIESATAAPGEVRRGPGRPPKNPA